MGEEEPKRAVEHKPGPSSEAEEERHHFKESVSNDVAHQKFLNPFAHRMLSVSFSLFGL